MQYDKSGRRLFSSAARAFKAQKYAALSQGVFSGVIQLSNGYWVLLHDPLAEYF